MKPFITLLFIVPFAIASLAQTDPLRNQLNSVFSNVDKSQIPTGFLQEYGAPLLPLDVFNGVLTDSNKVDIGAWRMVYSALQSSRIYGSNPLPTTAIANTAISNAETANPGLLVIPMVLVDYNFLRPDAITANLLSVSNNQLYDVAGRTQSPYYSRVAFAATPSVSYAATGTPSFIFKPELYYNASSKVLNLINVDFGDGRGYVNVTWNNPIAAAYTSTGTYQIKIKVVFTDNSFVECFTFFQVTQLMAQFASQQASSCLASQQFPSITGVHSGGTAYIRYSSSNSACMIVKPLIVAEGYDVSSVAPLLQKNYTLNDFINDINVSFISSGNFLNSIDIANYDIIFLDYNNGTDDIIRNAALLQDVITWVNQQKALAGSTQKNVVMGVSMGGLVARYCLANMTKQGIDPQTRLLLTHDSPHRGANTPIGFQFLTRGLNETVIVQNLNTLDLIPQISQANTLLDAPATSQMLILRATTSSTYSNNSFLDSNYRNMITFPSNGPQPTYTIEATSLGSECGMGSLSPGTQLLHVSGHFFISRIPWISRNSFNTDIVVNALPAYGASQTLMSLHLWVNYRILYYISIIVDLTNKAAGTPPNSLPWDGAPGGTQNVAQQAGSRIPSSNYQFGPFFNLSLNSTYAGDFCFVPTVSALDVTTINTAALASSYVGGTSPTNQARVANFIAQERFVNGSINYYNQAHPRFTPRNAQWMYNEMESPTGNNLNCSSDCQIDYGGNISGPSIVCSANSTFTVNNLPTSVTSISWSKSSNLNYYSGQSTTNYTVN
ncbi:MAG TPA: hypothetical protein VK517_02110 [Cyclobacteriaceae bacterium]|nr:hypothetical protein [Cyclobacteriaceae bacterium]